MGVFARMMTSAAGDLPLVIDGGSGVPQGQRQAVATGTSVCKPNIGTELRQAFGASLRAALEADRARFGWWAILLATHELMVVAAWHVIRSLRGLP